MMTYVKGSTSTNADIHSFHKEWDDTTTCPICMDHPHNAVLLICSSHEKGCRSYICDTSYRHSNCLDRFKKPRADSRDDVPRPNSSVENNSDNPERRLARRPSNAPMLEVEPFSGAQSISRNLVEVHEDHIFEESNNDEISRGLFETLEENDASNQDEDIHIEAEGEGMINHEESGGGGNTEEGSCFLKCPLCRGSVLGWMIVQEARQYLDLKPRSCSRESCSFSGNYRELRRHARRVHPTTRPADVDPSRQRAWRRLEHQREYGDILSAIRSAMPGAIVLGDYVIDNGDRLSRDRAGSGEGGNGGPWWTTFFLFHMISGPIGSLDEPRSSSRSWRTHRRPAARETRNLWGENLSGMQGGSDDADGNLDDDVPIPRRRRSS